MDNRGVGADFCGWLCAAFTGRLGATKEDNRVAGLQRAILLGRTEALQRGGLLIFPGAIACRTSREDILYYHSLLGL